MGLKNHPKVVVDWISLAHPQYISHLYLGTLKKWFMGTWRV